MARSAVNRVLGCLVTNESCREAFAKDADVVIEYFKGEGLAFTDEEIAGLKSVDLGRFAHLAGALDQRLTSQPDFSKTVGQAAEGASGETCCNTPKVRQLGVAKPSCVYVCT